MSTHTSGPWTIYPETDGTDICAVDNVIGLPIRQIIAHPVRGDNWIANARLIAAAPDLLDALQKFIAWSKAEANHEGTTFWERVEMLRELDAAAESAIANATGEKLCK